MSRHDPAAVANLVAHHQQQIQAPVNPQLRATLNAFWANQAQEMQRTSDFKNHNLPLARIKKIMKSDEDVRMISSEAPALFAKACEMFILEVRLAVSAGVAASAVAYLQRRLCKPVQRVTPFFSVDELRAVATSATLCTATGVLLALPPRA